MTSIDDPENLRLRAAEMRSRAESAILEDTKKGLLRIAGDFDVLAERAQKRVAAYARLQPELGIGDQSHDPAASEGHEIKVTG